MAGWPAGWLVGRLVVCVCLVVRTCFFVSNISKHTKPTNQRVGLQRHDPEQDVARQVAVRPFADCGCREGVDLVDVAHMAPWRPHKHGVPSKAPSETLAVVLLKNSNDSADSRREVVYYKKTRDITKI